LRIGNRFGVHVSSILRGRRRINIPGGRTTIFPGDKIQVIGSDEQLAAFGAALSRDLYEEDPHIERRETKLRQLILRKDSPFIGKTLQESGIRDQYNCMVVGVEAGQQHLTIINPSRLFQLGDIIWVVGEEESLNKLIG
jgi:CPA2 family monovalent cation:H+ antiporter-2